MKIALVAPVVEIIPPRTYGGIELIVHLITEGLVKKGHEVTLLATGDSKTTARLVPIFPQSLRAYAESKDLEWQKEMKTIALAESINYLQRNPVDIIHSHLDWQFLPFNKLFTLPVVTTFHGFPTVMAQQAVYKQYAHQPLISISMAQRRALPDLNYVATVYNGIEVDRFSFNDQPDEYLAFLGRMSPEKGPVQAIEVARATGKKLIMAAKIDSVDEPYFKKEVEPLIDGKQITFIGEVDHVAKVKLLKNASAFIFPLQWEEPFGLVMAEAMSCGTPVIAFGRGSVPEIVIHEKTGFVVKTLDEMIQAVGKINTIDRATCRRHVEQNFSATKMVDAYEKTYHHILEKSNS